MARRRATDARKFKQRMRGGRGDVQPPLWGRDVRGDVAYFQATLTVSIRWLSGPIVFTSAMPGISSVFVVNL